MLPVSQCLTIAIAVGTVLINHMNSKDDNSPKLD
jgi:hypothetical protein